MHGHETICPPHQQRSFDQEAYIFCPPRPATKHAACKRRDSTNPAILQLGSILLYYRNTYLKGQQNEHNDCWAHKTAWLSPSETPALRLLKTKQNIARLTVTSKTVTATPLPPSPVVATTCSVSAFMRHHASPLYDTAAKNQGRSRVMTRPTGWVG